MTDIPVNANANDDDQGIEEPSAINETPDSAALNSEPQSAGQIREEDHEAIVSDEQSGQPATIASSATGVPTMKGALKVLRKGGEELGKGAKIALRKTERLATKARDVSFRLAKQRQGLFEHHASFRPTADFRFRGEAYEIVLELPGLEPKDISVKLSDETVVISGKKGNPPIGEEKGGYFLHERRYGKFERSFRMPSDGNPGGIEASLNQGVLTVRIPKYADTARPEREIEVRPS